MEAKLPTADKPPPPSEPEKQTQKAILKRIVDPSGPLVRLIQDRCWLHMQRASPWLQPTMAGALQILPPEAYPDSSASSLTTRFAFVAPNRTRCSVNCICFTPEGRRCMTGDNIGQISLWSSFDFKYEQHYTVHNKGVRDLKYSHNGNFLFSSDDSGIVHVFRSNMYPLATIQAHREAVRSVTVAASDVKFATCCDDSSIKVWDLHTCKAEKTLTGHGSDVRCVDWHPSTSLIASCSRDGLIKLWDCRQDVANAQLVTLHGHKGPVNKVSWNLNGTWLASGSRDQTVRVWDVRHTKRELVSWQGHVREVGAISWHPIHLDLLTSAAGDGSLCFWMVGQPSSMAKLEGAHEGVVTGVAFHPMGHMLASSAMDSCIKFWVRPRPGDPWKDAQLKDQEEAAKYADLLASTAAAAAGGGQPSQQPPGGLLGPGGAGGPTTLPGGIAVQLPGMAAAVAAMGGSGDVGGAAGRIIPGIPGIPGPRPPAVPPPGPAFPGLAPPAGPIPGLAQQGAAAGVMGRVVHPGGGHRTATPPGMGAMPAAAAVGGGRGGMSMQGMPPGGGGPVAAGGPGGAGGSFAGRGRGRGRQGMLHQHQHQQQQHAGHKRPRDAADAGFDGRGQEGAWYPPPPHHQHQQQHHFGQHGHPPQQHHRPPYGRGFGRGFGRAQHNDGGRGPAGRGFAGGGRGADRGDYGGGDRGGRGFARGYGRR